MEDHVDQILVLIYTGRQIDVIEWPNYGHYEYSGSDFIKLTILKGGRQKINFKTINNYRKDTTIRRSKSSFVHGSTIFEAID